MKFGKHIHATHRMNNEISGDPLAFHLRPSSDQIPLKKKFSANKKHYTC